MDEVCSYIQDSVLCNRSTLLSQLYRGRGTSGLERMSYGAEQVIKYLAGCSKAVATGSSWACISMINKTPQLEKAHVRGVFHFGSGICVLYAGTPNLSGATGARVLLLARRKEDDWQDACN
jgi:hypothetical protein